MPFWILLVIRLVTMLPSLISVIREIVRLINRLPKDQKKEAEGKLHEIFQGAKETKFVSSNQAQELEKLLEALRKHEVQ